MSLLNWREDRVLWEGAGWKGALKVPPCANRALSGLHRFSNQHRTRWEYISRVGEQWGTRTLFHYVAPARTSSHTCLAWRTNAGHSPQWGRQAMHSTGAGLLSSLGSITLPDLRLRYGIAQNISSALSTAIRMCALAADLTAIGFCSSLYETGPAQWTGVDISRWCFHGNEHEDDCLLGCTAV